MNIKDFKVGQEAYALLEQPGRNTEDEFSKVIVKSIGRKYLKASTENSQFTTDYFSTDGEEYLLENKDWGYRLKLFPSRQALDDYTERKITYKEIRRKIGRIGMYDLTLDQLRKIRELTDHIL